MPTRTKAAGVCAANRWWDLAGVDLDGPRDREAPLRFEASGPRPCDEHVRLRPARRRHPTAGGRVPHSHQDLHDGKNIRGVIIHEH